MTIYDFADKMRKIVSKFLGFYGFAVSGVWGFRLRVSRRPVQWKTSLSVCKTVRLQALNEVKGASHKYSIVQMKKIASSSVAIYSTHTARTGCPQ